jgi:hypothetical protein
MPRALLLLALAAISLPACASAPPPRLPIAVVVRGDEGATRQVRGALTGEGARGAELRFVELPAAATAAATSGDVDLRLAEARRAYTRPDVPRCLAELGGDALVPGLLAEGQRGPAARVLFWRVACMVAGGALPDAARVAAELASYGLDAPPDVEAASPEAEAVLGRAVADVAAQPAVLVRVTTSIPGAAARLDGRPSLCVTPCRIDARPGPHVLTVELDGYAPERRSFVARGGDAAVDVTLTPAPADLAARQWSARYGAGADVDSPGSLRLLALAVRARSLVLITVAEPAPDVRLRGVLTVGGETRARAERVARGPTAVTASTPPLFEELLRDGKLVESTPLVKRPLFWTALVAVAAGAAVATYAAVHRPPTRTEVHF